MGQSSLEAAAGVDPIEALHARKRELLASDEEGPGYAQLWAKYGPGGTWEHDRKTLLAELILYYKLNPPEEFDGKVTEKVLDALAHDHPSYRQFLTDTQAGREAYIRLHFEVENLDQLALRHHVHLKHTAAESFTPAGV